MRDLHLQEWRERGREREGEPPARAEEK